MGIQRLFGLQLARETGHCPSKQASSICEASLLRLKRARKEYAARIKTYETCLAIDLPNFTDL